LCTTSWTFFLPPAILMVGCSFSSRLLLLRAQLLFARVLRHAELEIGRRLENAVSICGLCESPQLKTCL
jgi:hypothetical protein